jgi:phage host-nuclease inhibitor protein Gam
MFVDKQATISVSYADELESLQDEIAAAVEQVARKDAVSH